MNLILNKKMLFFVGLISTYIIGVGIVLVNKPENRIETKDTVNANIGRPAVGGSLYTIEVPSEALIGTLAVKADYVEKIPRVSEDWEIVASTSALFQDEKVRTDISGTAFVEILNHLSVDIEPETEIYFANILPESFVINHIRGIAIYNVEKTVSIKAIDTLTRIESGKVTLKIDPISGFINLTFASGSGKFSFIDNGNQTRIYEIEPGNRIIYNPENASVTIN